MLEQGQARKMDAVLLGLLLFALESADVLETLDSASILEGIPANS